jgi:hypothetical protein
MLRAAGAVVPAGCRHRRHCSSWPAAVGEGFGTARLCEVDRVMHWDVNARSGASKFFASACFGIWLRIYRDTTREGTRPIEESALHGDSTLAACMCPTRCGV